MTIKLYYEDAYIKKFTATVLECRAVKNDFAIVLDKTAFYPEGGGQAGDTGKIGDYVIHDTLEHGGEIFHYCDSPIEVGAVFDCEIDWARRFSLMQEHSGEHIVSGLIHEKYGYENVGFHMGADVVTIDFDGLIDAEGLREIENLANSRIWENRETQIAVHGGAELADIAYRSKKELLGDVRIVTFPDSDVCACCGTHVRRAGEIGSIRLLSVQNLRSGVRIEMLAGSKCFAYLQRVADENSRVAKSLSVKDDASSAAVTRLKDELQKLKIELSQLKEAKFSGIADSYTGADNVLHFEHNLSSDELCKLTVAIMSKTSALCAVFSGDDVGGYKYALGQEGGNLREATKAMNQSLNGRGGGKPNFSQGSVSASKAEIEDYFNHHQR